MKEEKKYGEGKSLSKGGKKRLECDRNIETITLVDKNKWFYEISRGGGGLKKEEIMCLPSAQKTL